MADPVPSASTPAVLKRRCPSGCGPLTSFVFRGVTLDRCEQCAGIWFDAHEYQTLDKLPEGALYTLDNDVRPTDIPASVKARATTKPRRCPVCESLMLPFAIHAGVPVTFDRCDLCDGIWADDSELAALCEALSHKPAPTLEETLPAEARGAIALASMQEMSAQECHRAHLFESLCAWIGRRPGLTVNSR